MATPVVSGAAALMIQENPSLTPDEIKARLMKTATKQFARYTTATDAHGSRALSSLSRTFSPWARDISISQAAITNTDPVNFQALSPMAQYNPQTQTVTLVSADALIWGTANVQSNALIWGDRRGMG